MSMLVLQPSIFRVTDCAGAEVKVSVGWRGVNVGLGEGVIVFSGVTGDITVTFEAGVFVFTKIGGGMMNGVGVIIPGVWVGIAVQTGNGCGATPQSSHEVSDAAINRKITILFIFPLYTCELLEREDWPRNQIPGVKPGNVLTGDCHFISGLYRGVFTFCGNSQLIPAWLHKNRSAWEYNGWNASFSFVYGRYKFSCFFVALQSNAEVFNVVGFKEGFCPVAIRTMFSCVHYDLRWIHVIQVVQGDSPNSVLFCIAGLLYPSAALRYSRMASAADAPSPAADAACLVAPARTSPAAKIPGMLVIK